MTANDFCGNFSAEYGGAISHYGFSSNGTISKNRIYYNQGYDEGGGIMIAGALPANNSALSFGAGAVTIDSNTLISNQSNDDGGGIRFLMAGNSPEMVSNNIIANNLSTHEGGGVALDDAPNVTIVNNTIVKNVTTATAATNAALANGVKPANPAGLSSGANSSLLQATLPAGSPNWSKPKLLNNVFADNRAGWAILPTAVNFNQSAIHGIGDSLDTDPIQRWDIGVPSSAGLNNGSAGPFAFDGTANTTNAVDSATLTNTDPSAISYVAASPNNIAAAIDGTLPNASGGVGFVNPQDFLVDSLMWRTNTNASFPVIVAHLVPINLLADYHLLSPGTTYALNAGLPSGSGATAPDHDIDGDGRPNAAFERGADEFSVKVDFDIAKTASAPTVTSGGAISYTIAVTNHGPSAGTATVTDTLPGTITGTSWTCASAAGAVCPVGAIPAGNLNQNVTLPVGATATFVLTGTVASNASAGSLSNVASVVPLAGSGATDTNAADNSSTATVSVQVAGNLAVAVTPPLTTVTHGQILPYVVTVTNTGPSTMSEVLTTTNTGSITGFLRSWTCAATAGSSCGGVIGFGEIGQTVTVAPGGSATFTYQPFLGKAVSGTAAFGSTIVETATLVPATGYIDTNAADNASSVTSTVVARLNVALTSVTFS